MVNMNIPLHGFLSVIFGEVVFSLQFSADFKVVLGRKKCYVLLES